MLDQKQAYKPMTGEQYKEIVRRQEIKRIQKSINKFKLTEQELSFA